MCSLCAAAEFRGEISYRRTFMNTASFFAPLIRGCIIQKTGRPCIVCAAETDTAAAVPAFSVTIDETAAQDEKAAAAFFTSAFSSCKNIPGKINVRCAGKEYAYLTAPDYSGIDKIKRGEQTSYTETDCGGRSDVVKNRVAVVTGGAQGFGEEIVRGLVKGGAVVCIADLNFTGAEKLAAALNTEYGTTVAFPAEVNVSDENSVAGMTEKIALTAGGLDLCISNAGVLRASSILEQDIASFKFVTDINYTAFAIVTKYCARLMKRQHETAPSWMTDIIQINSKSGLEGSNKNGSYAGSKCGSIGLVQSFAKELVEYGTKVNAICPGNFFDGPLWSDPEKGLFVQYLRTGKVPGAKTVTDVKAFYEAKVPMNRGCTGPDVIRAVFYLVEQVYETGQALPVTGGQVMLN